MSLSTHFLIDFYECDAKLINDQPFVRHCLLEAARISKATIVTDVFHSFNPHGLTGVVVIAESHISIHTWPELAFASVDIYTCSQAMDAQAAIDFLLLQLRAERKEQKTIPRGFPQRQRLINEATI